MTTTPKGLPVKPPDHLSVRITVEAARALTEAIKHDAAQLWDKIVTAYTERAWDVLGYGTWDQYCAAEFGSVRLRLPREERRDAVCSLRESGLSIRAISAATGISDQTVQRDLASGVVNHYTSPDEAQVVDAEMAEPAPVTGTDGKTYRPKRKPNPKPPKPEPVNEAKAAPAPEREPVEEPMPEPPGGLTENTPGMTDRVMQALGKAQAKPQEPAVEPEVIEADVVDPEPEPEPEPEPVEEPKPEPPGGVTPNTPGMTPAVQKALADAKAAQAAPPEAAPPEEAPAEELPAQPLAARTVDEWVQVLVDATVALEAVTEEWDDPHTPPMPVLPFTEGACAVVNSVGQRLWDVESALHYAEVSSVVDRAVTPPKRRRGRPPKHKPPFDHKPPLTITEDGSLAFPDICVG